MAMRRLLPVSCLALAALLAGCTLPSNSTETSGDGATGSGTGGVRVDAGTYTITLTNFNGQSSPHLTQGDNFTLPVVRNGTAFEFTMKVDGSAVTSSTHIGGHFGTQTATTPSTAVYTIECAHVSGLLPQTHPVTCQAPTETGTYHIRGHARIVQDGQNVDWWSGELAFRVT